MDEIKRIDRTLVRNCKIFDYYQDTMAIPNGNIVTFDHIDHKGAAAVVPVLEDGRIILVRQFRNSIDRNTWEIPAGGLNTRQEYDRSCKKRIRGRNRIYDQKGTGMADHHSYNPCFL